MNKFAIFTDSGADIGKGELEKWGVRSFSLSFRFADENTEYTDNEILPKVFYSKMRDGAVAKTSATNPSVAYESFDAAFREGLDILYLGFSSGLSTTYSSALLALSELKKKYPERRAVAVDTLCASAGQGMLVYCAVRMREEGMPLDEIARKIENMKLSICHWFTVEDLVYLKRGGRIGSASALVGGMLGIKPIMHVDNEGHLVNVEKVRGRKRSILALAEKYSIWVKDRALPVFISHADCEEDALFLAGCIKQQRNLNVEYITSVGTVIGAHSGPGTLALFFFGKER